VPQLLPQQSRYLLIVLVLIAESLNAVRLHNAKLICGGSEFLVFQLSKEPAQNVATPPVPISTSFRSAKIPSLIRYRFHRIYVSNFELAVLLEAPKIYDLKEAWVTLE
jgi:hypothetical protein